MPTLDKIFVVIDPTTDNQVALSTAARFADQGQDIVLHVYDAVSSNKTKANAPALQRAELVRA